MFKNIGNTLNTMVGLIFSTMIEAILNARQRSINAGYDGYAPRRECNHCKMLMHVDANKCPHCHEPR